MSTGVGVHHGLEHLQRLAPALDDLAASTGAPASTYTESVEAFLRPRPTLSPLVVTVPADGALVAATVLAVQPSRWGSRVCKAGVAGEPFRLVLGDPSYAGPLAAAVVDALAGLDRGWRMHLRDLPEGDPTVEALRDLLPHHVVAPGEATAVLGVGAGTSLEQVLSRNVRAARNKAVNRIARTGRRLTLGWTRDLTEIAEVLPEVVALHIGRNQQLRGHALLRDTAERATFCDVLLKHAEAGRVRLLQARIDDELAAFAACLVAGRRWWVYSNYAHSDFLELSPGTIANAEVVRAAHADPDVDLLDWGAGVQRYKLSGGAELVASQHLRAWSHRYLAALAEARGRARGARHTTPLPADPPRLR